MKNGDCHAVWTFHAIITNVFDRTVVLTLMLFADRIYYSYTFRIIPVFYLFNAVIAKMLFGIAVRLCFRNEYQRIIPEAHYLIHIQIQAMDLKVVAECPVL